MKKQFALLTTMAAMFMGSEQMHKGKNDLRPEDIDTKKKEPPLPKGCQEYSFHGVHGEFKTVAMSHNSAKKKFTKWLLKKEKEANGKI